MISAPKIKTGALVLSTMIPLLASGIAAAYNSDDSGSKTNGLDKNNTGLSESWLKEQSPVVLDGTLISAAHGSYDEVIRLLI